MTADLWTVGPMAAAYPLPKRRRCDGSHQLTMTAEPSPCPVCGTTVATVPLDGRTVLVEHRAKSDDALPMSLEL